MKCSYCGSSLQIEDEKCPHCGAPNPHYIRHRQDMRAYEQDFESTKSEVLENTSRLGRRTVRIAVTAVLVALCAVAFVLCLMGDDIRYARQEKQIVRDRAVHESQLHDYMDRTDILGLYEYASSHRLTYTEAMREYDKVFSASMYYRYVYEYTMELMTEGVNERYESVGQRCESIAKSALSVYETRTPQTYDKPETYEGEKGEYLDRVVSQTELILRGYFHLTEEETTGIPEMTHSRLAVLLEEGLAR